MKNIEVNFSNISISFYADCDEISDYIIKEFENQYLCNSSNIYKRININIYSNKKYEFIIDKKITDNVFKDKNGRVLQVIKAKGRKTVVIYNNNFEEINVYIPYKIKKSKISKITNPKYITKWENCLVDFFQGPFIGIMEYLLLNDDLTFIHGCSFSYKNKGYVFCGKAQVGKTEIVNALKQDAKILSDDLTILSNNQNIIPYQKSIGVFSENIDFNIYFKHKTKSEIVLEKINLNLFNIFKFLGFKTKRIVFFKEMFNNSYDESSIHLNTIYFVVRDKKEHKIEQLQVDDFVSEMVIILENEFNNLQNFWTILKECTNINKEDFINKIEKCLKKNLEKIELVNMSIPFYNDKNEFREKIKNILITILNKGGNSYEG